MENEANSFASNFLLPSLQFKKDILHKETSLNNYIILKHKWKVSISSMIYRANSLGLLTPNEFRNLQKRLSYNHWRKEEPFDKDFVIRKPVLMEQAFNLINQIELFDGNVINELLEEKYGLALPLNVISELLGVPNEKLRNNSSNIVTYKS